MLKPLSRLSVLPIPDIKPAKGFNGQKRTFIQSGRPPVV